VAVDVPESPQPGSAAGIAVLHGGLRPLRAIRPRADDEPLIGERGFVISRILSRVDPWLDALRTTAQFSDLKTRAEVRCRAASSAFRDAGGARLLGVGVPAGVS
jgi:hypothetical protein